MAKEIRGDHRGFQYAHLPEIDALSHPGDIICRAVGKTFVFQPDAGERMACREHNQRIEPDLFQSAGRQDSQIEASPHAML